MGADAHGVVQRGWVCTATQWIQGWELSSLSTEQSLLRKDHSEQGGQGWSQANPGHVESYRARQLVREDKERLKVKEL